MEYTTLYELHENGEFKEIKVPKEDIVGKRIDRMLKEDKEMLEILEKL